MCNQGTQEAGLGGANAMGEMDDIILWAPLATLLLPLDRHGLLGHARHTVEVPSAGLTCWQLLQHVHAFYQASLVLACTQLISSLVLGFEDLSDLCCMLNMAQVEQACIDVLLHAAMSVMSFHTSCMACMLCHPLECISVSFLEHNRLRQQRQLLLPCLH